MTGNASFVENRDRTGPVPLTTNMYIRLDTAGSGNSDMMEKASVGLRENTCS